MQTRVAVLGVGCNIGWHSHGGVALSFDTNPINDPGWYEGLTLAEARSRAEKAAVQGALHRNFTLQGAARELGLSRQGLRGAMRRLGVDRLVGPGEEDDEEEFGEAA